MMRMMIGKEIKKIGENKTNVIQKNENCKTKTDSSEKYKNNYFDQESHLISKYDANINHQDKTQTRFELIYNSGENNLIAQK